MRGTVLGRRRLPLLNEPTLSPGSPWARSTGVNLHCTLGPRLKTDGLFPHSTKKTQQDWILLTERLRRRLPGLSKDKLVNFMFYYYYNFHYLGKILTFYSVRRIPSVSRLLKLVHDDLYRPGIPQDKSLLNLRQAVVCPLITWGVATSIRLSATYSYPLQGFLLISYVTTYLT